MTKPMQILVYLVLACVLLSAAYFLFLGVRNIWRGLASPQWPKAAGIVVVSDTSASTTSNTTTSLDTGIESNRASTQYAANTVFRYNVNGQTYSTPLLYFGQTVASGDPTEAQLRHLRYPQGAQVPISYNPANPAIAAAEPGFHSESLLLVLAGLGFAIPCILAAIFMRGIPSATPSVMAMNQMTGPANLPTAAAGMFAGLPVIVGLFASVFALLGIGALTLGLINLARAHASQTWPTAPGTVTYQSLNSESSQEGQSILSSHLIFTFEVDGKKRYSNLRRFGLLASTSDEQADKDQAKYPQGQTVTVAYNPDNPNLAVLEPGIDNEAYTLPVVGLALLLFSTLVVVFILPAVSKPFGD